MKTGKTWWETDTKMVDIEYVLTDDRFAFDLDYDGAHYTGVLTRDDAGAFNGTYTCTWKGPTYQGDISQCRVDKQKLVGTWFDDGESPWHVEFENETEQDLRRKQETK